MMLLDQARQLCRNLYHETLKSLQVGPRLAQALRLREGILEIQGDAYSLAQFREIRIISLGKVAIEMAEAVATALAGVRFRGLVISPQRATVQQAHFEYICAGHPYPNERSWQAAEEVLEFLQGRSGEDLILFLLSGGGSALLDKPLRAGISLEDLRRFHAILVTCGASIQEMNALRKHLSAVKGGRLAEHAAPATQITLYVSDVPDSLPSAVASGPTMPDETTVEDCHGIVRRYSLLDKSPVSVRQLFESGDIPETLKPGQPCFAKSRYYCLLSNRDALERCAELARQQGVGIALDPEHDERDCACAADALLQQLETLREQHPGQTVALISGGELSCPVMGEGIGGRNQAFVLHCVSKIAGRPVMVLSAGTDGVDGNSPAAGAIADGYTAERAATCGLVIEDFLRRADSYHFFETLGDAIVTGPTTGTNVRDLRILLAHS